MAARKKVTRGVKVKQTRKPRVKVTKQKAAKPAKHTAVLRKLAPVAKEINTRLEKASQMTDKAFDHRLAAAIRLGDAKETCEKDGA